MTQNRQAGKSQRKIAIGSLASLVFTATAAQLDLPNTPLFLSATVQPNIMLVIDDSGSMDWDMVTRGKNGVMAGFEGGAQPECVDFVDTNGDGTTDASVPSLSFASADCDDTDDAGRLVRQSDGNLFTQKMDLDYAYAQTAGNKDSGTGSSAFAIVPMDEMFDPASPNYRALPSNSSNAADPAICPLPDRKRTGFWRAYSSAFNALYYDPETLYVPWSGVDNAGNAYGDADPASVRLNPYDASTDLSNRLNLVDEQSFSTQFVYGSTDNNGNGRIDSGEMCRLSDGSPGQIRRVLDRPNLTPESSPQSRFRQLRLYPARYYRWTDSNNDGMVDPEDVHALIEIRPPGSGSASYGATAPKTFTHGESRSDCTGNGIAGQCTAQQELQNFANWFQYYRRRELSAKAAFGAVAARVNNVRMGMVTLNDNNIVHSSIRSLGNGASANRSALLDRIYRIDPVGSTPLKTAVDDAGSYLACGNLPGARPGFNGNPRYTLSHADDDIDSDGLRDSLSDSCPALNAAKGGSCQQNYLIAMTDGYYNTGNPEVGDTDSDRSTAFDGGAYADHIANTLADIAMKYYENDLQPSLPNEVRTTPNRDTAPHQHMVSYTVAFGVEGTLTANPSTASAPFAWPDPGPLVSANPEKIDDLRHAAFNGRGQFLSARRPDQLLAALQGIIGDITARIGAAAAVAQNSGVLKAGTRLYQALFNSADWSGQLLSIPVSTGNQPDAPCQTVPTGQTCPPEWNAGLLLNSRSADSRVIVSYDPARHSGIAFTWNSLSDAQKASLNTTPTAPYHADSKGQARLEYLRGDRRNEAAGSLDFRVRSSLLGDIVDSDPFYVGAPPFAYPFDRYADFRRQYFSRTAMVYVGANDGMLHGFRAGDGQELLAYVPGAVYGSATQPILSRLTPQAYTHVFTVDGSPTVGDVRYLGGLWRSILVGGLRSGGQAVYALDVTDPSQFAERNSAALALWEFSDADDPDLGYSYGQPSLVRLANGRWVALIASGYNNTQADRNASSTGRAALFVLNVEGPGADGVWNLGSDYIKLAVGPTNAATPNGLATPAAVDIDGDGGIDRIYAGDLLGNLWRFNVSGGATPSWSVAYSGARLYVARDADGNPQPITTRPEVGFNAFTRAPEDVTVYFGTGRYIDRLDNSSTGQQTQSFYAIFDQDYATPPALTRSKLLRQSILQEVARASSADSDRSVVNCGANAGTDACFRVTTVTPLPAPPAALPNGWFIDLFNTGNGSVTDAVAAAGANQGERVITAPTLRNGRIIFTTTIPSSSPCASGGGGWLMELDAMLGARLSRGAIDITRNGTIDAGDDVLVTINGQQVAVPVGGIRSMVGMQARPSILSTSQLLEKKLVAGSTGGIDSINESSGGRLGRITWRELTPP